MSWKTRGKAAALIVCAALFLLSAGMVASYLWERRAQERAFDELEGLVRDWQPPAPEQPEQEQEQPPPTRNEEGMLLRYLPLYQRNPDFFGWVSISGTRLSYPVMHTPEQPEYYLRRDFDGAYSLGGVPFLAGPCTEEGGNWLIYGHNMDDGSMFAALLDYADEQFWREHPVITFDTLYEQGEYEVLAAFYSKAYQQGEQGVFRYYRYTDLSRPEDFEQYIAQVQAAALYGTGVEAAYGEKLITLSTCSYHTKDGRFVVVARERREQAEEKGGDHEQVGND